MINITIQIKGAQLVAVAVSTDTHQQGDVIGVYDRIAESPSPASTLVFVHVDNVPAASVGGLQHLTAPYLGDIDVNMRRPIIYRHDWWFDPTLATVAEIDALTVQREITIDWTRAKQVMKRRSTGAFIMDADLNG